MNEEEAGGTLFDEEFTSLEFYSELQAQRCRVADGEKPASRNSALGVLCRANAQN